MPKATSDLHGSAPDKAGGALLLVDVINDFDFTEAEQLLRFARPMAERIALLKERAAAAGVPVIYANDNFGRWRSDFNSQIEHCLRQRPEVREIIELLHPGELDYFVLKPKHSGFFSTTLDTLLRYLGAHTLIIAGVATNICVLFTANDAYMRDYQLIVPNDCVAANTQEDNDNALEQIRVVLKATVCPSESIDFERFKHSANSPG
jgi:nicotinamidase-related amidase